ncbi:MAG: polysaccharide lyase family protein [Verrucomicrobiota bacterium]
MRRFLPALASFCLSACPVGAAEVELSQDSGSFRISNGDLSATIDKSSGRVTAVVLDGQSLLGKGTGYWSMAASSARSRVGGFGISKEQFVSIDPKSNGGERAEVVCRFSGKGTDGAYPGRSEIRYSIGRESTTLYATAILNHGEGDAPFRIGEGRFVIKLDSGIFDQLTVDKDRNWVMPTGRDWDEGSPLNLKEARRMTSGIHAGWAEHKYSYSAILEKVPAYGWVGTKRRFGVWMINPSIEYIAGGPTKMELTGHLDVGGDALPTLLNMWHGSHYGGAALSLDQGEKWSKVIGPFAIHFNKAADPGGLWNAALGQATLERAAWPYPWVKSADYPVADARGGLAGRIRVEEIASASVTRGDLWIGLASPDYTSRGRNRETIGWQRDGKYYQYWVRAQPDGSFSIAGVRPGTYVLHAFADGILGEFVKPGMTVGAGRIKQAGDLRWSPERAGPTLWEIGVPDRGAAEFRNGDRYWYWGNYLKFKTDFPNGVDYVVGRSDWKKDWNICQPLDLSADCEVLGDSAWTVRFPLEKVPDGGTCLRVAFCGSREGSRLSLLLNDREIGNTGPLPENGAMHRDSYRGMWFERSFLIPAERLKTGENVLRLRLGGTQWHQGVLYDYLRMEAVSSLDPAP